MKAPVFLAIFALLSFATLATGCQDDACDELDAYFDECCSFCGSSDTYCTMTSGPMSVEQCTEANDIWGGVCYCD